MGDLKRVVCNIRFQSERILLEFADGSVTSAPLDQYPYLLRASLAQCLDWRLSEDSLDIVWPSIGKVLPVAGFVSHQITPVCIPEEAKEKLEGSQTINLDEAPSSEKIGYINSDKADCRYKPENSAAISMTPPYGEAVVILKFQPGWTLVRVFSKEAWIQNGYISTHPPAKRTQSKPASQPVSDFTSNIPRLEVGSKGGIFTRTKAGFRRYL